MTISNNHGLHFLLCMFESNHPTTESYANVYREICSGTSSQSTTLC